MGERGASDWVYFNRPIHFNFVTGCSSCYIILKLPYKFGFPFLGLKTYHIAL